jgi:hypothetical protein
MSSFDEIENYIIEKVNQIKYIFGLTLKTIGEKIVIWGKELSTIDTNPLTTQDNTSTHTPDDTHQPHPPHNDTHLPQPHLAQDDTHPPHDDTHHWLSESDEENRNDQNDPDNTVHDSSEVRVNKINCVKISL